MPDPINRNERWMSEARRYAGHIFCYPDLIDDHIDVSVEACLAGQEVYEFVEWLGEHYDLERVDQGWGIHAGVSFAREL